MKTKTMISAFNNFADKKRKGVLFTLFIAFVALLSSCSPNSVEDTAEDEKMSTYLASYNYWELQQDNSQYIEFHLNRTDNVDNDDYYSKLKLPDVGLRGLWYVSHKDDSKHYISLAETVISGSFKNKIFNIVSLKYDSNILMLECDGLNFTLIGRK